MWRESRRYDSAQGSAIGLLPTIVHRRAVDRVRSAQATLACSRRVRAGLVAKLLQQSGPKAVRRRKGAKVAVGTGGS